MQESYREGGSVRTRTVEYLGAMEPAVATQVKATRKQLGQADMAALVQSVRKASSEATRTPEKPPEAQTAPPAPKTTTEPAQRRYERMTVNGRPQLVDTQTGELIEPQDKPEVITTEKPTLRPFADSLKLPPKIETHKLSRAALHGTHRKFGERLKGLQINPAAMPDVVVKYGHPDSLKQHRDGSYIITASRKPKRDHSLNKAQLWKNYRHALSRASIDAIEAERPEVFATLQSQLSTSHQEGKRLLFEHIAQTTNGAQRLGLSLQLYLWDKLPAPAVSKTKTRGKPNAKTHASQSAQAQQQTAVEDLGQMSFETVNNWRAEAALILAEAHKNGWNELTDRTARTARKHKAAITKKRRELDSLSRLDKLAGKRRKLLREIMQTETKHKASQKLQGRIDLLRRTLDG